MRVTIWLALRRLRTGWIALVPVAAIVALGGAGMLVALETAQRTSSAFPRYLERAEVSDLVINPSLYSAEIDEVIRGLPGVTKVTSDALLFATIDFGGEFPVRYSEVPTEEMDNYEGVLGSSDGRYIEMDRLAYREGRAATGPSEAVVSVEMAEYRGYVVGDVVEVAFVPVLVDMRALYFGEDPVITPLGVEHLTIVGIATLPTEVLPDGLYPRGRMIVSPDVAARYDCLPTEPPADAGVEEALFHATPPDCSALYRYWSLAVDGGARGVETAQEAFVRAAEQRNAMRAPGLVEVDASYILITTTTAVEQLRVQRSLEPTVAALTVLGLAAGVITAVVGVLAVVRVLRRAVPEQVQWWHLGLRAGERTRVVVLPLLAALVVGVVGALALAWWWSPVGPMGQVRAIEPSPGRGLGSGACWAAAALGSVVAVLAVTLGWRSARIGTRPAARDRGTPRRARHRMRWPGRPEVAEGLRSASGAGRGGGVVIAGGALAMGAIVAATVFGSSLSNLLRTPAWYGWPWDAANIAGAGYMGIDPDEAAESFAARDEIEAWAGLGFWQSMTVDGVAVPSLIAYGSPSELDLAMVEGRLPIAPEEVALGSRTAAARGLRVGDEVTLAGDGLVVTRAEITGLAVLPTLGPLQSDRATPGEGMLLPAAALDPGLARRLMTFTGLDLRSGADPDAVLASLQEDFTRWDSFGQPRSFARPVLPAEIGNARAMRVVPVLVAALVGGAAATGLAAAMVASVNGRRRELGILRSLGFTGRQVRRSVRVQALATVLAALIVGVPVGLIAGRFAWRTFAERLGVVTTPSLPLGALGATLAGAVLVAVVVAALPARLASRLAIVDTLRGE